MDIVHRDAALNRAKESSDTSDTLRLAIARLQEIEQLACHPNSDPRIAKLADATLWDIAINLPV